MNRVPVVVVKNTKSAAGANDCPLFRESSVLLENSSCVIFAVSGDYCQVIHVGNTCMIVGDH